MSNTSLITNGLRATILARRANRRWRQMAHTHPNRFDIQSQASTETYQRFISTYQPRDLGRFHLGMRKSSADGPVMLALCSWESVPLGRVIGRRSILNRVLPERITRARVRLPCNPFRLKFVLSGEVEPKTLATLPNPKNAPVCVVTAIQGPKSTKYKDPCELAQEARGVLGKPWQNFLLGELLSHAVEQGCSIVTLLRPEFHPTLQEDNLVRKGLTPEEVASVHSHYYAAARHNRLRKVKGSRYFWFCKES